MPSTGDIPKRYYRFAHIALELAKEAKRNVTHQLCAILVRKNRVLAIGYNSPKTHTISRGTKMQQLHAEHDAIVRCSYLDLQYCDMIVVRSCKSGAPGLAKPCEYCQKILKLYGIRRVYYTTNNKNTIELEKL